MVALIHWVCLMSEMTADVMAPCLSVVFWQLVCLGSIPACWRKANVTPILKAPPSSSVANFRLISITSLLSKVFAILVSVCHGRFMELGGVLPTPQFAYWKGLGTCDALLCMSYTLQSQLESGHEARIVQIDFSAAFDRVNYLGSLYKLCSVGIGGAVLSILTVSIKPITARYGGWLSEKTGYSCIMNICRAVFWACYCTSCTLRNFFPFWKIS